ncbi:MAG: trypsin-like peptidase domain-containing protein [Gemmatimonadota bacterium]
MVARLRRRAWVLGCVAVAACDAPPPDTRPANATVVPTRTAFGVGAPAEIEPQTTASAAQSLDDSRSTAIVRATARVAPAVVSVNVLRTRQVRARSMWESMYLPPGAEQRSASFGSGVIVSQDGIVITNDHVISGASEILVTLPGGIDVPAEVVGTDPIADIAVLRINVPNLPVAPVGTANGLMIGEWAIAIGNPLGNYVGDSNPTVTAGVISAVDRNIAPSSEEEGFYFGMIQTDAAINPGNSGGALVNANGELIGINASIISRSGGSEGLGFAIPIDRALQIAQDFLDYGEVRRAFLGLEIAPAEADPWGRRRGVVVSRVAEGSPAADARIQPGDMLLAADGRALTGPLDWEGVLLDLREGDAIDLVVEGRSANVPVEAVAFPSATAARVTLFQDIDLISVTPQVQLERGLVSSDGALITDIGRELASRIPLREGDVIVQINRARIRSADDAARFFDSLRGEGRIVVLVERNGSYGTTNLYWRGG